MSTPDVVVVGAGPAGIGAALEAARAGASVVVLDEYPGAGGQYYRQPTPGLEASPNSPLIEHAPEGRAQIRDAQAAGVEFRQDVLVWGAFSDGSLTTLAAGKADVLKPSKVILATGGYERAIAFPGWTLPGVITAGAAQALVKGQGVLPGRRILLAGTGPLQVAVAAQLVHAGGRVVGVLEANHFGRLFRSGPRFWGQWARLQEGYRYWRTLRFQGVPLAFGRTVLRAVGNGALSRVVTAALDAGWRPVPGTETEVEVDTLCLGFGLVPNTKLARLMGCDLIHDPCCGGVVPVHNDDMETSRTGVFVAGEAAGVAGAKAAEYQGRIAGIHAARQLGKGMSAETEGRLQAARRHLRKEMRFARALNEVFAVKPGILDLVTDETVICRCEEITWGRLRRERSEWATTLDAVRSATRAGFGLCQGTICEPLVADLLARATEQSVADLGSYHIRPPLKPITVGALADLSLRLPPPPKRMDH